jgi:hypothetical protein
MWCSWQDCRNRPNQHNPPRSPERDKVAIEGRKFDGSADEAVVLAFNAAINHGDLPGWRCTVARSAR